MPTNNFASFEELDAAYPGVFPRPSVPEVNTVPSTGKQTFSSFEELNAAYPGVFPAPDEMEPFVKSAGRFGNIPEAERPAAAQDVYVQNARRLKESYGGINYVPGLVLENLLGTKLGAASAGGIGESVGGMIVMNKWLPDKLQEVGEHIRVTGREASSLAAAESIFELADGDNKFSRILKSVGSQLITNAPYTGAIGLGGLTMGRPGAYLTASMLMTGASYSELRDRGVEAPLTALGIGLVGGLLESQLPVGILNRIKFFSKKEVLDKAIKEGVSDTLMQAIKHGAKTEAWTEFFQELLQAGGESAHGVGDDSMAVIRRALNAFVFGGVTGGFYEGISRAALGPMSDDPIPEIEPIGKDPVEKPQQVENVPDTEPVTLPTTKPIETPAEPPVKVDEEFDVQAETLKVIQGFSDQDLQDAAKVSNKLYLNAVEAEQERRSAKADTTKVEFTEDPKVKDEYEALTVTFDPKASPEKVLEADVQLAQAAVKMYAVDGTPESRQLVEGHIQRIVGEWTNLGMPRELAKTVGQLEASLVAAQDYVANKPKPFENLTVVKPGMAVVGEDGTFQDLVGDPDIVEKVIYNLEGREYLDLSTPEKVREAAKRTVEGVQETYEEADYRNIAQNLGYEGFVNSQGSYVDLEVSTLQPALSEVAQELGQSSLSEQKTLQEYIVENAPKEAKLVLNAPIATTGSVESDLEGRESKEVPVLDTDGTLGTIPATFAKSTFGKKAAGLVSDTVEDMMDLMEIAGSRLSHPLLTRPREFISGTALLLAKDNFFYTPWGRFIHTRSDGKKAIVGINPFMSELSESLRYNHISQLTRGLFNTIVHELTHLSALHEGKFDKGLDTSDFPQHLSEMLNLLEPLFKNFERKTYAIYGDPKRDTEFSKEFDRWAQSVREAKLLPSLAVNKRNNPRGRPARGSGTSRSGVGGTDGGESRAGNTAQVAGGEAHNPIRQDVRDGYRSDYPAASGEYESLNERTWSGTGEPEFRPKWTSTGATAAVRKVMDGASIPEETAEPIKQDVVNFHRRGSMWLTFRQITDTNLHIEPMKRLRELAFKFQQRRIEVEIWGDKVLKDWEAMSKTGRVNLHKFIHEVTNTSWEEKRLIGEEELRDIALKHHIGSAVFGQYQEITKVLRRILESLRVAAVAEKKRQLGPLAGPAIHQINIEFQTMRDRNYFPMTRFGEYAVYAKALEEIKVGGRTFKKGQLITLNAFETLAEQEKFQAELMKTHKGKNVEVRNFLIDKKAAPLLTLSPALFDMLVDKSAFTEQQIRDLREIVHKQAPGSSFLQHMARKQGVAGGNLDSIRSFANYIQSASGYLARLEYKGQIEQSILDLRSLAKKQPLGGTRMSLLRQFLEDQVVKDLFNPSNSAAGIRGFLYLNFLAGSPKQALVNLMQVPVFTYSWLAKNHGGLAGIADVQTARLLVKSMKDLTINRYTDGKWGSLAQEEYDSLAYGDRRGITNQSYATHVGMAAGGSTIRLATDYMPKMFKEGFTEDLATTAAVLGKKAINASTYMLSASEHINRRITWLSAFRLAKMKGMTTDQANEFAEKAVVETQGDYSALNRPMVMKGNKALFFVFRSYQQFVLHGIVTNKFGWRFWAVQMAMAGLLGLPFAEDLEELLSWAISFAGKKAGWKNPQVDVEAEMKRYIEAIAGHSDQFMYGAASHSMGLPGLDWLAGTIPNLDWSSSMSLGRVIPGIRPFFNGISGQESAASSGAKIMTELAGVAAPVGMNYWKAITDGDRDSKAYMKFMPNLFRSLGEAGHMWRTGAMTDSYGNYLASIDKSNHAHLGEVLGRAMGFYPTRARQVSRVNAAGREAVVFYDTWKSALLQEWARSFVEPVDREGQAAGYRALRDYNDRVPDEFKITSEAARAAVTGMVTGRAMSEMGLPTRKALIPRWLENRKLYAPSQPQP